MGVGEIQRRLLERLGRGLRAHPGWFLASYGLVVLGLAGFVVWLRPAVSPLLLLAIPVPLMPILYPRWVHRAALVVLYAAAAPLSLAGYVGATFQRVTAEVFILAAIAELVSWVVRERGRMLEAVRRSEARYRVLVETANVVPWELELPSWRFTYVGPQAVSLFGYPTGDWYRENFWPEHLHPDDREWAPAFCEAMTERGEDHEFEYRMLTADGSIHWIRDIVSVVSSGDGPERLRGVMVDVTEQHRVEDERLELEAQSRRTEKIESLGVFAGGFANDFNNLLVAILGNAQQALEELPAEAAARGAVEEVASAARRAAELTRQTLLYAGGGAVEMHVQDLSAVVSASGPALDAVVSERVRLTFQLAEEPIWVEVDGVQTRQVVVNLLTNAVEALDGRSGEICVSTGCMELDSGFRESCVVQDVELESPCAFLAVEDTGEGMSPEVLEKMFDPFFTTRLPGRGLGLAGALGMVRRQRGTIQVESQPGRGTRVRMLLPRAPAPDPSRARAKAPAVGAAPAIGTVLFVDDEEAVVRVGRRALERAGFHVTAASDGVEALEALERLGDGVRVVVLDAVMPRLGGREVLDRINEERPDLPVVISSGFDALPTELGQGNPCVRAFLPKPYLPSELVACLREVLGADPPDVPEPSPLP